VSLPGGLYRNQSQVVVLLTAILKLRYSLANGLDDFDGRGFLIGNPNCPMAWPQSFWSVNL
jgi:hypothetical protein